MRIRKALLTAIVCAGMSTTVLAQRPLETGPQGPAAGTGSTVEVAPIRCWWRSSVGAIVVGEPFDVRLTCAVLESESVQVVPDETRLAASGVQLPPFEILGGEHPADTHAGMRRFFQYRYTLRLVNPDEIGQEVALPRLPIIYKVQSQMAENALLTGRDFTYMMPGLPLRVVSLVPSDAGDIRDGMDVGLERVDALRFRARLADIVSITLFAAGALAGVLALVGIAGRVRAVRPTGVSRLSSARVLAAADRELSRVADASAGGWTLELLAAAHRALRVIAAVAMRRDVSEQRLPRGTDTPEGRIAVRALLPWRAGASISSAVTAGDLARGVAELPGTASADDRLGLESLHEAMLAMTRTRYEDRRSGGLEDGESALDERALTDAVQAGRREAARLRGRERWVWLRRRLSRAREARA
ncbi:MAG: hypothetical protein IT178_16290 [Acidobacteria bacterium]|nr:hypothetical protein [Acidobacteriota bacterium]